MLSDLVRVLIHLQVLDRLVLLRQALLFFFVHAVAFTNRHLMSVVGGAIMLLVGFVVVFVHVFDMNRVLWFTRHFFLGLPLVWVDDRLLELVGMVAMSWHILDGRVN